MAEIVYFSSTHDATLDVPGQDDIFAVDPQTGRVRRLTDDSSGLELVCDRAPAWSPDRTRVAIQRGVSSQVEVVVLDAATGRREVTVGPGAAPVWVADDRLAYLDAYAPHRVLTAPVGSGEPTVLLELPEGAAVVGLGWHPEQGLAFGYDDPTDAPATVGVLPAARVAAAVSGAPAGPDDVVLLGRVAVSLVLPDWHPGGERLAVAEYRWSGGEPERTGVGVLDLVRRTYRRVDTPDDGLVTTDPRWSPDGSRLVLVRGDGERWSELWCWDEATEALTRLTDDGGRRLKGGVDW